MNETAKPPYAERTPKKSTVADSMITLGVLTAACETADPTQKIKCKTLVQPLERNARSAQEVLADVIVEMGEESLDDAADRFNFIVFEATQLAKEKLIALGKLKPDGTPVIEGEPKTNP